MSGRLRSVLAAASDHIGERHRPPHIRVREVGAGLPVAAEAMGVRYPMANDTTDQIHSIAALLAASLPTAAVGRMLGEHTADATGHCRGCRYPTTASPVWPCRLWEIGNEARRIRSAAQRP